MREYNIRDFGAIGDGKTMNTEAIGRAVDACGGSKAVALGLPDNGDTSLIPTDDEISEAKRIICG